ncbi:T9SS type A sorting domain-containing protein [Caldithrix abyssi]|nr:T9SS type A sorting domain-containing protein [Caldithrix abyssi]
MNKTILITILVLFSLEGLNGQGARPDEVYFRIINAGGSSVRFSANAHSFVLDINGVLTTEYSSATTDPVTEGGTDLGFNFMHSIDSPSQAIAFALYTIESDSQITTENGEFYYDTRDCDYINSLQSGSPDVYFIYDLSDKSYNYYFTNWPIVNGQRITYDITPGDTIRLSWAYLDPDIIKTTNPKDLPNPTNYACVGYTDITLTNKYETFNIGDFLTVNNVANPVSSGSVVPLLRGEPRIFGTVKRIDYNSIETNHHYWDTNTNKDKLKFSDTPDGDKALNSWFKDIRLVTLTTGTNVDVPISIHDPWYVDPDGSQLDRFHELNATENPGGSYKVFLNEGDINDPNSWDYAVSAPSLNYSYNAINYIFTGWSASGADLAPYPGQESDPLIRKVLFKQAGAVATANYMRLDAMDGVISRDMTFSGNLTVSGTVTIAPGTIVTFSNGTVVQFNPGAGMVVKGELKPTYSTFTRSDPNSSNRNYWEGITVESGGRVWLVNGTVEGATNGLFGNYGDARATNSTFRENDTGFYLNYVDTYYSHDNTFTNNNYGVRFHYSNVEFHDNTFTNNTYDGFHVLKSTGKTASNIFKTNSSAGVRILNQGGISLTDLRMETDIANINNVIENNGSYGIYVDATSGPDLGTYSQYWKNGYIYGGFNRFNRGTGGYDIYSLYSGTIKAEMNWWDTEVLYGNIDVITRAKDYGGGGEPVFKILAGGDSGGDTQIDSLERLLMTANSLAADSLYDEAVALYRDIIDLVPSHPLSAIALTRLFGTYKLAKFDIAWNTQLNDSTLLVALNEIHTNYGVLEAGLAAYDFTITLNAFLGKFPEALNRGDKIIKIYAQTPGYKEKLAYALFEQGGIYKHLSRNGHGAGKITAGSGYFSLAESNYDRILSDFPQSEAANLVRMLKGEGAIEDEPVVENIPKTFKLHPAFPNPFNPSTTIRFAIPNRSRISLNIYDIAGKEIKRVEMNKPTGTYHYIWDGKNNEGQIVSTGVYLISVSIKGDDGVMHRDFSKVMFIK